MIIDPQRASTSELKHIETLDALNETWFEQGIEAIAMLHRKNNKLCVVVASYNKENYFKTSIDGLPVKVELREKF